VSSIQLTNLGSSVSTPVVPLNPQCRKLTFHNPNTVSGVTIFLSVAPIAAAINAGLALLPGGTYDVYGDLAQAAWNAIAASGGANGFTALISNWPPSTYGTPLLVLGN
jgi:hypothetical protein